MPIQQRPGFGLGETTVTPDFATGGDYATISYDYPTISMPAIATPNVPLLPLDASGFVPPSSLNTGGGGFLDTTGGGSSNAPPWWGSLISGALNTASSILKVNLLPSNSVVRYNAAGQPIMAATGSGVLSPLTTTTSFSWIIYVAIAAVFVLLLAKKK